MIASAAATAVALATLAACSSSSSPDASASVNEDVPPRNVIFLLGDGMEITTLTVTRIYKVGESGDLTIDTLPETGFVKTFSRDAQTTDSAPWTAACVAHAARARDRGEEGGRCRHHRPPHARHAGRRVRARLPPRRRVRHRASGRAGWHGLQHGAGQRRRRDDGRNQYYWTPFPSPVSASKGRSDGRNLVAELQAKGFNFVSDVTGLNVLPTTAGTKVIGLFDQAGTQGHMSYDLDRDPAKESSLPQMTTKAIDILSKNGKGFVVVVEGGRIDHALHATYAARAFADTIAFDDAIRATLAKVDMTNTLVVVTVDHDHTMAINGYSSRGNNILGKVDNWQQPGVPVKANDGKPYTTLVIGNGSGNGNRTAPGGSGGASRTAVRDDPTSVDTTVRDFNQDYGVQRGASGAGNETHGSGDVPVDAEDSVVVDVDAAGFTNFGFHGSWARARHLADPDPLAKMRRVGVPDANGAQWHEARTASGSLRVLWDERRHRAVEVTSESADGRSRMTTRAQMAGVPRGEPWSGAAELPRKSWYDLLD